MPKIWDAAGVVGRAGQGVMDFGCAGSGKAGRGVVRYGRHGLQR